MKGGTQAMGKADWSQMFEAISPILKGIVAMILSAIVLLAIIANVQNGIIKELLAKLGWIVVVIIFLIVLLMP